MIEKHSDSLGGRMREARRKMSSKVTQGQMAEMISKIVGKAPPYQVSSVSNWERGQDRPPYEVIRAWARVSGVAVGWLLSGDTKQPEDPPAHWHHEGSVAVPLLTPDEALKIPLEPWAGGLGGPRIQTQWRCSPTSFAIDVFDSSNEPDFIPGATRLVVDPEVHHQPGDIVFASVSDAPVVGTLREAPKTGYAVAPKNPAFRERVLDEGAGDRVIGVITEWITASRATRRGLPNGFAN